MSLPKALFEEISAKALDVVNSNPVKDLEKNIKALVKTTLTKMNIVTRDEFDRQKKMLQKALIRLSELEEQVQKEAAVKKPKAGTGKHPHAGKKTTADKTANPRTSS